METTTQKFSELLLGNMDMHQWLFSIFIMTLGIILYVLLKIKNRRDKETRVSLLYWIKQLDNVVAILISIILTYVLIRFYSNYQQIVAEKLPDNLKITPYFAMLLIGFYQHKLSVLLSKKVKKL